MFVMFILAKSEIFKKGLSWRDLNFENSTDCTYSYACVPFLARRQAVESTFSTLFFSSDKKILSQIDNDASEKKNNEENTMIRCPKYSQWRKSTILRSDY